MLTSNQIKRNIEWFFDKTISMWYDQQIKKYGALKELLEEPSFCNMVGLTPFSVRRITDEEYTNFINKFSDGVHKLKNKEGIKKVDEIQDYLNEGETEIRYEEVKSMIKEALSKNLKYIEKSNINILWNNIENPLFAKRYYAYIKAKQFTKNDDDVEYNPRIIINKSVSLIDLEKVKEDNYKVLEQEDFFAANDGINTDTKQKKKGKKKDNETDNK